METEERVKGPNSRVSEEPVEKAPLVEGEEKEQQHVQETNEPTENRTRLVIAGLVAAAVVSIVAVLVAGIFQLTSKWVSCKPNLPVSDPAPILWGEMVSDTVAPTPLGVPKVLANEVKFKGLLSAVEAGQEK
jgi:hypothetical protein